jgi:hypothetical protein
MNARTQITLDPETQRRAHTKAADLGISFAEYVRRLITADLGAQPRRLDISALFDLGASTEPTDIARDKEKLLNEATWADHLLKTGRKPARRVTTRSRR